METKKLLTIEIDERDYKDFQRFCDINGFDEIKKVKQCFTKGYNIEKYGTLSENEPRVIEKEIIVEKEIIKEVPVEKIIEVQDDVEINDLKKKLETLQNQNAQASNCDELRNSVIEQQKIIRDKSIMINKLERRLKNCIDGSGGSASFMRSSNIKF